MSTNTTIHVGFWTNWAKGPATGSTLTLSNRNGAVLIAALAIFIQLAGGRSWTIISFIVHQIRTTRQARDGVYHQQQVTLRNNNSDISAIWQFTKIGWAWRSRSGRSFRDSLILISTGVIHLVAFVAAGILSSHITSTGSQVLIARSPYCGMWQPQGYDPVNQSSFAPFVAYNSYSKFSLQASKQYVEDCLSEPQSLPECDIYKQVQLNWSSRNTVCPFDDSLCLGPANGSLYMDTGLLDSRDDFGVNSQDKDRVQWRRNVTCVPITTDGYVKSGNSTLTLSGELSLQGDNNDLVTPIPYNYTAAYYGPSDINGTLFGMNDPSLVNATYVFSNYRDYALPFYNREAVSWDIDIETSDYQLGFDPIPALANTNSTLALIFASFYGIFTGPSDDLWLSAHYNTSLTETTNGVESETIYEYILDKPISVLGCTEQFQFCNPTHQGSSACSPPLSVNYMEENWSNVTKGLFDTKKQQETALAILISASFSTIVDTIEIGDSPLLVENLAESQQSLPPANNQWELESKNWFTIGLANTQRLVVDYVTGPPSQYTEFVPLNQAANNSALAWLCESQTIRRSDFSNFSTLAIFLVFGFGSIIIGISLCLESVVGWQRGRRKQGEWRQKAWWSDGILQLQMRALKGVGVTGWDHGENMVPVNEKGKVWSSMITWDESAPSNEEKSRFARIDSGKWSQGSGKDGPLIHVASVSSMGFSEVKRVRSNSV
ncbi:hypothetical protein BDZ45DRAFT_695838 [Acephala macrosclerotiorum]|nr:hypothetical protein BDZ45DRAFT_695838 [Acephala macrosclerotiorum]